MMHFDKQLFQSFVKKKFRYSEKATKFEKNPNFSWHYFVTWKQIGEFSLIFVAFLE